MPKEKNRGALLTVWLILMLIGNIATTLAYLVAGAIISIFVTLPVWVVYTLGFISILNIVSITYVFRWKKWAFFTLCGLAAIIFFINILLGVGTFLSILGLGGPLILYLLLKPKWDWME